MNRRKNRWGKKRNNQNSVRRFSSLEHLENRTLLTASGFEIELPTAAQTTTAEVSAASEVDQARIQRIVNGTQTSEYESVGIVNGQCSGTLIAPNVVLTAAHCIPESGAQDFVVGGRTYAAREVFVHPDYQSNDIDLAVMILQENVAGVDPVDINRTVPQVGQVLTLVGFGATGTAQSGHDNSFGVKHVGQTPIDEVTPDLVNWNYDDPAESNTAPGDSGGAAFLEIDGKLVLAGVTSGGTEESAGLGDKSFDMRVDAFASWIDDVIAGRVDDSVPVDDGPSDEVDDIDEDDMDDIDPPTDELDDGNSEEAVQLALEELFYYDTNGDDELTRKELINEFVDFGYSRDEARDEVDYLLQDFDLDGNSRLDFAELVASYGGENPTEPTDEFDDVDDPEIDEVDNAIDEEFEDGELIGDFDDNGYVDFGDFLVMSTYYGNDEVSYAQGDTDGNAEVDFADFLNLSGNYGNWFDAVAASAAERGADIPQTQVDEFFASC